MTYVSNSLQFKRRNDLEFDSVEMIWLDIKLPAYNLLLCTVYRPENATNTFCNNFQYSIETALSYTPFVVITGDLIVNLLSDCPHIFKDLILIFNLTNVITEPTRITINSSTLLGPILIK